MTELPSSNPSPEQLRAWCRAAADGDEAALQQLMLCHHGRFAAFARRKIGVDWQQRIDADDLLQEAYIEVYRAIAHFSPDGDDAFYAWVSRIIDHAFIDRVRYWKRQKRDPARETAAAGSQARASLLEKCQRAGYTPSLDLRREDAEAALLQCLARLPDDYRLVVQRLYLHERPLAEVAADLGRTDDAVRRLAGRAIEKLNECLGRASRFFSSHG